MTRYFEYGEEAVDYLRAHDKKLAAGVPVQLRAGDGFYLANRNTRFLVTME